MSSNLSIENAVDAHQDSLLAGADIYSNAVEPAGSQINLLSNEEPIDDCQQSEIALSRAEADEDQTYASCDILKKDTTCVPEALPDKLQATAKIAPADNDEEVERQTDASEVTKPDDSNHKNPPQDIYTVVILENKKNRRDGRVRNDRQPAGEVEIQPQEAEQTCLTFQEETDRKIVASHDEPSMITDGGLEKSANFETAQSSCEESQQDDEGM